MTEDFIVSRDVFMEKHWKTPVGKSLCDYFFEAQRKVNFRFESKFFHFAFLSAQIRKTFHRSSPRRIIIWSIFFEIIFILSRFWLKKVNDIDEFSVERFCCHLTESIRSHQRFVRRRIRPFHRGKKSNVRFQLLHFTLSSFYIELWTFSKIISANVPKYRWKITTSSFTK